MILGVFFILTECNAQADNKHNQLLVIKEQGAFSAGGTIVISEGIFDPLKPWYEVQGGQTRHGDHADVFYQVPANEKYHSMIFFTAMGNHAAVGKLQQTDAKVSPIFFSKKDIVFIWLISPDAAMPDKQ